jgi:hypothetical protein
LRTTGADSVAVTKAAANAAAAASLHVTRVGATDTIQIVGTASDVTETSHFDAYAIDGGIVRIEEQAVPESEVKFSRVFTYDKRERLSHMTEDKWQMVSNTNASPSQQHVTAVLNMDSTAVIKSAKRVDGVEKPMQSWDVDNVRRHADLLVTLARPGIAKPIAPRP